MKPISDLGEYQAELAHMLLAVNRVCREHDLRYHLAYGTALGAFRHEGLIPWDRDVDITVRVDEYEDFCATLRRELPPTLRVEDCRSSSDYELLFARVSTIGVKHNHLHLDIFPVAGAPSSPLAQILVLRALQALTYVFTAKRADFSLRTWWGARTKLVARLVRWLALPLTDNVIIRVHGRLVHMFPLTPTAPAMIVWGGGRRSVLMPERFFGAPAVVPFLGDQFPMPSFPEEYLTHVYGDFRTLPSVDAQQEERAFFDTVVLPRLNR
jgi:lipopolysaccharide cholinephosphotransferase